MKRLSALLFTLVGVSCSVLHSTTERRVDPKTGVITEETHATGFTVLDGNASLAKFTNRSSPATNTNGTVYAPGTYASGVEQQSSGSNLVLIISGVSGAVVQGVVSGVK